MSSRRQPRHRVAELSERQPHATSTKFFSEHVVESRRMTTVNKAALQCGDIITSAHNGRFNGLYPA